MKNKSWLLFITILVFLGFACNALDSGFTETNTTEATSTSPNPTTTVSATEPMPLDIENITPSPPIQPTSVTETSTPVPIYVLIDILSMNSTSPFPRDLSAPIITITGSQLEEVISFEFTQRSRPIQLPAAGTYTFRFETNWYETSEKTITLTEPQTIVTSTMQMQPLDPTEWVVVGNTPINVETGEQLPHLWSRLDGHIMWSPATPTRLLNYRVDPLNQAIYEQFYADGSQLFQHGIYQQENGIELDLRTEAIIFDDSLQRAIYTNDNDLWLADMNWNENLLTGSQRITQLGLFDRTLNALWFGDYVLADENDGIHINLITGEFQESATRFYSLFPGGAIAPDWGVLLSPYENFELGLSGVLWMYDVAANTIEIVSDIPAGIPLWLDNERALVPAPLNTGNLWLFDRPTKSVTLLSETVPGTLFAPSPTGNYVFVLGGDSFAQEPSLYNVGSGKLISFKPKIDVADWITDSRVVFSRGGSFNDSQTTLEDRGTWLYDASTNELIQLTPFPYSELILIAEKEIAIFIANENLWRVDFDGSNLMQLTNSGDINSYDHLRAIHTINLP